MSKKNIELRSQQKSGSKIPYLYLGLCKYSTFIFMKVTHDSLGTEFEDDKAKSGRQPSHAVPGLAQHYFSPPT